jgi:hypothetical protein
LKTQIIGIDLEALVYRGANIQSLTYKKTYLKEIKGANYILPLQVAQFMKCFSKAGIFDPELFQKLEQILFE